MNKPRLNSYDPEKLENYLTEIDAADAQLETLRSEYMNKCKAPQSDIAAVFEASKEAGIPQRAFRTLVKNRRLERKIEANEAALESDDAENLEAIKAALGPFLDTPLGRAAIDRRVEREQTLDTLTP